MPSLKLMSCGCGFYRDALTGLCAKCYELCLNAGKACSRLCPCYAAMQQSAQEILDLERKSQMLCAGYVIVAVLCFLLGLGAMALWKRLKSMPYGNNVPSEDKDGSAMLATNGNRRPSSVDVGGLPTCKETNAGSQTVEKQYGVKENCDIAKPLIPIVHTG